MDAPAETLSMAERLIRYRALAQNASRQAARSLDPAIRADLLGMAAGWSLLVQELEKAHPEARPLPQNANDDFKEARTGN